MSDGEGIGALDGGAPRSSNNFSSLWGIPQMLVFLYKWTRHDHNHKYRATSYRTSFYYHHSIPNRCGIPILYLLPNKCGIPILYPRKCGINGKISEFSPHLWPFLYFVILHVICLYCFPAINAFRALPPKKKKKNEGELWSLWSPVASIKRQNAH